MQNIILVSLLTVEFMLPQLFKKSYSSCYCIHLNSIARGEESYIFVVETMY